MVVKDLYKPVRPMVNRKMLIPNSLVLDFTSFVLGKIVKTFGITKFYPLKVDQNLYSGSGWRD